MPGVKEVQHIIKVSTGGKIVFSGSKLRFEAVKIDIPMTPVRSYTSLLPSVCVSVGMLIGADCL